MFCCVLPDIRLRSLISGDCIQISDCILDIEESVRFAGYPTVFRTVKIQLNMLDICRISDNIWDIERSAWYAGYLPDIFCIPTPYIHFYTCPSPSISNYILLFSKIWSEECLPITPSYLWYQSWISEIKCKIFHSDVIQKRNDSVTEGGTL